MPSLGKETHITNELLNTINDDDIVPGKNLDLRSPTSDSKTVNNSKIRKIQDDLLRSIFSEDNDDEQKEETRSIMPTIIIGFIIGLIMAVIAYFALSTYFGDQLDSAMLWGGVALAFVLSFVIAFFLFKPSPVKKDKVCDV